MISIDDEQGEFRSLEYQLTDGRPNPEQIFSRIQISETLQRALDSLPYPYRVVFEMRDVEGMSILDTAEVLELSIPSVKARLRRARLKLRKDLSPRVRGDRAKMHCSPAPQQRPSETRAAA